MLALSGLCYKPLGTALLAITLLALVGTGIVEFRKASRIRELGSFLVIGIVTAAAFAFDFMRDLVLATEVMFALGIGLLLTKSSASENRKRMMAWVVFIGGFLVAVVLNYSSVRKLVAGL